MIFRNTSSRLCSVAGGPTAAWVEHRGGRQIGDRSPNPATGESPATDPRPAGYVKLAPGAYAHAQVSSSLVGAGDLAHADGWQVSVPGVPGSVFVSFDTDVYVDPGGEHAVPRTELFSPGPVVPSYIDWTVSTAGVGPFALGMTLEDAEATGLVLAQPGPVDPCPGWKFNDELGLSDDDLSVAWAGEHGAGWMLVKSRKLRTAHDLGVGSSATRIRAVLGRKVNAEHDQDHQEVLVVRNTHSLLEFILEHGRTSALVVVAGHGLAVEADC